MPWELFQLPTPGPTHGWATSASLEYFSPRFGGYVFLSREFNDLSLQLLTSLDRAVTAASCIQRVWRRRRACVQHVFHEIPLHLATVLRASFKLWFQVTFKVRQHDPMGLSLKRVSVARVGILEASTTVSFKVRRLCSCVIVYSKAKTTLLI